MSYERRRKAAERALSRRHGMTPDQAEELERQVGGRDDWRVHCHGCDTKIVGSQELIRVHAEECRGA
jgi:hypothetical protein